MSDIDLNRYLLTEAWSREIFRDEIVPDQLSHGVPQEHPVVVFVCAQPGAGKTKTTEKIKESLDRRGGSIVVDADVYKAYHPRAFAR